MTSLRLVLHGSGIEPDEATLPHLLERVRGRAVAVKRPLSQREVVDLYTELSAATANATSFDTGIVPTIQSEKGLAQ